MGIHRRFHAGANLGSVIMHHRPRTPRQHADHPGHAEAHISPADRRDRGRLRALADAGLPSDAVADAVLVEKSARRLTLLRDGRPVKVYRVALGRGRSGARKPPHARRHLHDRLPERRERLAPRPPSLYPDSADVARARAQGVSPGAPS